MKHAIAWLALLSFILPAYAGPDAAKKAANEAFKQEKADWQANGRNPPKPRKD